MSLRWVRYFTWTRRWMNEWMRDVVLYVCASCRPSLHVVCCGERLCCVVVRIFAWNQKTETHTWAFAVHGWWRDSGRACWCCRIAVRRVERACGDIVSLSRRWMLWRRWMPWKLVATLLGHHPYPIPCTCLDSSLRERRERCFGRPYHCVCDAHMRDSCSLKQVELLLVQL